MIFKFIHYVKASSLGLALFGSLLILPNAALAAISVDAVSQNSAPGGGSPISWSHTNAGNFLLVCVTGPPDASSWSGVSATYGSDNLTELGHTATDNGAADWWVSAWGEINPPLGTHTVTVTGPNQLGGAAISYNGVDVSGGLPSFTTGNSGGSSVTSYTTTGTVSVNQSWLSECVRGSVSALSAGTGTTLQKDCNGSYCQIFDSGSGVGTGSQSLVVTGSSQKIGSIFGILAPAVATSTPTTTLSSFGLWGTIATTTEALMLNAGVPFWELALGILLALFAIFFIAIGLSRPLKKLLRF